MNYEAFLKQLDDRGWSVQSKSYATCVCGDWQVSFVRFGGKFQKAGIATFVVCVRHCCLRDLEKAIPAASKNPNDYPFKLTLNEITGSPVRYESRLLNYERSDYPMGGDWSHVYGQMEGLCTCFSRKNASWLQGELKQLDNPGYIERIWLEDLAAQQCDSEGRPGGRP